MTTLITDEELALGRIYADAMLPLTKDAAEADALLAELQDLAAYFQRDPDFAVYMASTSVDEEVRKAAIEKLFRGRYSDLLVDSLQVLNGKDRAGLVPAIAEAFRHALDDQRGRVEARVTSAVPLTDSARGRLRKLVKDRTGRDADLLEAVDESLIGGIVVQIGDEKLDGSVSRQLHLLGATLQERASREIHSGHSYVTGAVD